MNQQTIKDCQSRIETAYENYRLHLKRRANRTFDLNWLLQNDQEIFCPDYFTFSTIGKTKVKSRLNRNIATLSNHIWKRLVLGDLLNPIIKAMESQYIPKLLTSEAHAIQHQFAKHIPYFIHTLVHKDLNALQTSSFTDFFKFMFDAFHIIQTSFGIKDPYFNDKTIQNKRCLNMIKELDKELPHHSNKEAIMIYLVTRSNWIDSVEKNAIDFLDLLEYECSTILDESSDLDYYKTKTHYNPKHLLKSLQENQTILYETDNAGEIIFDLYFIQSLIKNGHTVTICCKKHPVMNDITESEIMDLLQDPFFTSLKKAHENKTLSIISHHTIITGKYPERVSETYKDHYLRASLNILKGQGNFHTLPLSCRQNGKKSNYTYKKPHLHLMGIKAKLIYLCLKSHHDFKASPPIQDCYLKVHRN